MLHASIAAGGNILRISIGCESDDREFLGIESSFAKLACRFQAIHHRHLHIHQHQIERFARVGLGRDRSDSLRAVGCEYRVDADFLHHRAHQGLIDIIIFRNQYSARLQLIKRQ